jgi:hypothetical protein
MTERAFYFRCSKTAFVMLDTEMDSEQARLDRYDKQTLK